MANGLTLIILNTPSYNSNNFFGAYTVASPGMRIINYIVYIVLEKSLRPHANVVAQNKIPKSDIYSSHILNSDTSISCNMQN